MIHCDPYALLDEWLKDRARFLAQNEVRAALRASGEKRSLNGAWIDFTIRGHAACLIVWENGMGEMTIASLKGTEIVEVELNSLQEGGSALDSCLSRLLKAARPENGEA